MTKQEGDSSQEPKNKSLVSSVRHSFSDINKARMQEAYTELKRAAGSTKDKAKEKAKEKVAQIKSKEDQGVRKLQDAGERLEKWSVGAGKKLSKAVDSGCSRVKRSWRALTRRD